MVKSLLTLTIAASLALSCAPDEKKTARLLREVDSLSNEIEIARRYGLKLHQIGQLLDSIDASRFALRTRLEEGTSFQEYTSRMRELNAYVRNAENRIAVLEKSQKSEKRLPSSFVAAVKKLRQELRQKENELESLHGRMKEYRRLNDDLLETATIQELELADKTRQLEAGKKELARLEKRRNAMKAEARRFEAEAYYLRALAVEETANRTRFAPRKKRKTQRAALELYRLAATYGKAEARLKVKELQEKI